MLGNKACARVRASRLARISEFTGSDAPPLAHEGVSTSHAGVVDHSSTQRFGNTSAVRPQGSNIRCDESFVRNSSRARRIAGWLNVAETPVNCGDALNSWNLFSDMAAPFTNEGAFLKTLGAGSEMFRSPNLADLDSIWDPKAQRMAVREGRKTHVTIFFSWIWGGGQGRNRTADASLFRAALYQLSYLAGNS